MQALCWNKNIKIKKRAAGALLCADCYMSQATTVERCGDGGGVLNPFSTPCCNNEREKKRRGDAAMQDGPTAVSLFVPLCLIWTYFVQIWHRQYRPPA